MKKIYLLRHCAYSNPRNILVGRLPVELSEDGKKHAQKLAKYFADKKVEKIYSSAVKRCQQTSEIVSEIVSQGKISIENDQRILETLSAYQGFWGGWNGKELDWKHFFDHRDEVGGESAQDIQDRVVLFFEEIIKKDEGDIIICSHGDPLYFLFLYLIGETSLTHEDISGEPTQYQPKGSIRLINWQDKDNFEIDPIFEI